jgi:hypothetical protein
MRTDRWRERPFGSSEGLEIGSLFQQQPLIYIQNFPRHTPKQSHTSIPRRLSPDASLQIISLSGSDPLVRRPFLLTVQIWYSLPFSTRSRKTTR